MPSFQVSLIVPTSFPFTVRRYGRRGKSRRSRRDE
jgi:hypothetical protein